MWAKEEKKTRVIFLERTNAMLIGFHFINSLSRSKNETGTPREKFIRILGQIIV